MNTTNITVNNQPFDELPQDLFIPPEALQVFLEMFEGPLDLLLYLIRKQNIDILQIPIASITNQYVAYIHAMQELNIELASEYLLMAAVLLEIKSRILLPKPKQEEVDEDNELDPKQELIRRLIEYEQIKQAAHNLNEVPQALRDFMWVDIASDDFIVDPPQVKPEDLQKAWHTLLIRSLTAQTEHHIKKQELSIREHMTNILRMLRESGCRNFYSLFDVSYGISYLVVNFIAILELGKEGMVVINKDEKQNIWVDLAA
jgi:segregation and condensation protein A